MKLKKYESNNDGFYDINGDGVAKRDIIYSDKSVRNKLDLYIPSVPSPKYPLVVFVHGGAFFKSSKDRHLSNILNCLLYGYAVASIDYRLNDEAVYPDIRQDCIDAFNYLAGMEAIDSKKIIFWGESHGAFMADDIAITCRDKLAFEPAGVVSFYAPIDLYDYFLYKEKTNTHVIVNGKENDSVSFGAVGDDLLKLLKEFSPADKVNGSEPPFFLLHGEKDDCIPVKYTKRFDAVLTGNNVPHTVCFIEDGIHGIDFYTEPKYNSIVLEFIDNIFKGKRPL